VRKAANQARPSVNLTFVINHSAWLCTNDNNTRSDAAHRSEVRKLFESDLLSALDGDIDMLI
jgi:hypothetical protein